MPRAAEPAGQQRVVHFVGFRDERYWNAVRVFGEPDFIHRDWDVYALGDIAPWDVVVHADGEADRTPRSFTAEAQAAKANRKPGT